MKSTISGAAGVLSLAMGASGIVMLPRVTCTIVTWNRPAWLENAVSQSAPPASSEP